MKCEDNSCIIKCHGSCIYAHRISAIKVRCKRTGTLLSAAGKSCNAWAPRENDPTVSGSKTAPTQKRSTRRFTKNLGLKVTPEEYKAFVNRAKPKTISQALRELIFGGKE